jgi:hypothetical protein
MAVITINDLEMNEELDGKALDSILGGRWVRRRYRRTYYRTYRRRFTYYRTYRRAYTRYYTRRTWVRW